TIGTRRSQLLDRQAALVARRFERDAAAQGAAAWDADAAAAAQTAAARRAQLAPLLARLAELETLAGELDAARQAVQNASDEVASISTRLDAVPALAAELE